MEQNQKWIWIKLNNKSLTEMLKSGVNNLLSINCKSPNEQK